VLVDDELWAATQPLIPSVPRRRVRPGRERLDDRAVLNGILFVLHTGIAWRLLHPLLGFDSGG
jgi:transposase